MTEEQIHALIESLWLDVARCGRENDRWQGASGFVDDVLAAQYRGERRAYRDVIERINALRHPPDAPGRAEAETQPPAHPSTYAEKG
jgi:hypothetical protein